MFLTANAVASSLSREELDVIDSAAKRVADDASSSLGRDLPHYVEIQRGDAEASRKAASDLCSMFPANINHDSESFAAAKSAVVRSLVSTRIVMMLNNNEL